MITELKVPIIEKAIQLKDVRTIETRLDENKRMMLVVLNHDGSARLTLSGFPTPLFEGFLRVFTEAKQAFDCGLKYTPSWRFISEYTDSPPY